MRGIMASAIPETYRVADLLHWHKEKTLVVNQDFQRRSVWTPSARSYLIDTILRQLPMPMMYMRTTVDPRTQRAHREIVDGQQRLKTLVDFASNKLRLDKRTAEFSGLTFEDLDEEHQQSFLAYPVTVIQLINARDADVLEVFGRLNSYNVALNEPEQRHAKHQSEFKWAVRAAAARWSILWERYRIVTVRQRVRMLDDSLMAEMFGIILQGVTDGGQRRITQMYERYKREPWNQEQTVKNIDSVLQYTVANLCDALVDNLARPPHFLMLFAATAHALIGIPPGAMGGELPERDALALSDVAMALVNLEKLNRVIGLDDPQSELREFWRASARTTHRIASRRIRFPTYYRALLPMPL